MYQLTRHRRFFLIAGLILAVVSVLARSGNAATSSTASITAVNIIRTDSTNGVTSATISFSFSSSQTGLRYQVNYGPTTSYSANQPPQSLTGTSGTVTFSLTGLAEGTTYHFNIQLLDGANAEVAVSTDRTFSTPRSGSTQQLVISNIRMDCVDQSCTANFSTNKSALVEAKWSSAGAFDYAQTGLATTAENAEASGTRSMQLTGLTANTTYHYRLRASNAAGESIITGDLTFTTSASSTDHVFATGVCSAGGVTADIGSCLGNQLCFTAGVLVNDCTKCGYTCSANQSCRAGSPASCLDDQALSTPSIATQCNASTCYNSNGQLFNPVPAGCYSSWPQCTANTILKVTRDRGCNLWLSCASSVQVDVSGSGNQNLCLSLAACNSLGTNGQCNHYLPSGQCSNDPLRFCNENDDCQAGGTCNNPNPNLPTQSLQDVTYQAPSDVSKIANLSGNVLTGLDWGQQGGANVIQGGLPWQLMRQVGGDAQVKNGDFEYNAPSLPNGWITVPTSIDQADAMKVDFEDVNAGPNHVLTVDPVTQVTAGQFCSNNSAVSCTVDSDCVTPAATATCQAIPFFGFSVCSNNTSRTCTTNADCTVATAAGATCTGITSPVENPGVATNAFTASPSEYYYAEARIRGNGSTPRIRMEFGFDGFTKTTIAATNTPTYVDIATTAAWQRVTLGPLIGMSGSTRLAFLCADSANCSSFQIDDIIVKPILQTNTNPSFITPSCRLYPKDDSPACDYADTNGIVYKGWKGYCLEHDSQTGTCLSWWPVDILKGESNVFGTETAAGYQDRSPLYLCAESVGASTANNQLNSESFTIAINHQWVLSAGCSAPSTISSPFTMAICSNDDTLPVRASSISWHGNTEFSAEERALRITDISRIDVKWLGLGAAAVSGSPFMIDSAGGLKEITYTSNGHEQRISSTDSVSDPRFAGRCSIAPCTVWKDEPVSYVGQGGDAFGYYFVFNAEGQFETFGFWGNDETGDETEIHGFGVFIRVREQCTKLVQVVGDDGSNAAFSGRERSSSYKVPDLGYGLSTDLTPFGGALQPEFGSQPPDWGLLNVEQRNNSIFGAPGQSRAGSPYACDGPCGNVICTVDNSTCLDANGNIDQTLVSNCQKRDIDGDGTPDGQCVGVSASLAGNKGNQNFSPSVTAGNAYFAQERIKRLFAQSYGVWTNLRCTNDNTQTCMVDAECGAGTCSARAGSYALVDNSRSNPTANFVGWNPPATRCPVNPASQGPICTSATTQCTQTLQVTGTQSSSDSNSSADRFQAVKNALGQCGLQLTGGSDPVFDGLKVTNVTPIMSSGSPQVVACNGGSSICPGDATGPNPYSAGTSAAYTDFTLSSPCSYANGRFTCSGRCSSTQQYIKAGQTTAATAAPYLRPAYQSGSNADYCAIPPMVSNAAFVNGTSNIATITGGSGAVTIKFNTNADAEQLPLKNIRIDWGDSQDVYAFPYAPRNDATKPHIFTHTYVLNKGDAAHCKPFGSRTACEFPIKIQVEDNWSWCNDGTHGPCATNSTSWYNTGLKVTVQP